MLMFDFTWDLMHFSNFYMSVTAIFHHIFGCSGLFRVDADVWQHVFCDYPINIKQVKKDISVLLIA